AAASDRVERRAAEGYPPKPARAVTAGEKGTRFFVPAGPISQLLSPRHFFRGAPGPFFYYPGAPRRLPFPPPPPPAFLPSFPAPPPLPPPPLPAGELCPRRPPLRPVRRPHRSHLRPPRRFCLLARPPAHPPRRPRGGRQARRAVVHGLPQPQLRQRRHRQGGD